MHFQRNGIPLDCSSTLALHDQHLERWKLPTGPPQAFVKVNYLDLINQLCLCVLKLLRHLFQRVAAG